MQEPIKKQSPSVNDKTNSENVTTLASGSVGPPSLLRRKRVLPNLGSASRRRHSSVSKENIERTFDVPEVHNEEVVSAENELSDGMVSIPSDLSTKALTQDFSPSLHFISCWHLYYTFLEKQKEPCCETDLHK